MNRPLVCCTLFSLAVTVSAPAQTGRAPGRGSVGTSRLRLGTPDQPQRERMFVSGKVVLDDGTILTEPAAIQTICRGQKRTETYTDSRGSFSFEFGNQTSTSVGARFSEADTPWADTMSRRNNQRDWRDCELQAALPGFSSQVIQLSTRASGFENSDIGRVALHRLSQVEGFTISATSALAPPAAKKVFEKGRDHEKKSDWDTAQQCFEKAVQIYPKYAVAWFELGRAQLRKKDVASARYSFGQALAADPKYVNPYQGLADLALREKQWQTVVDTTGQLLALNPVSFPDAWFQNAIGNYELQNLEAAEKSARQGLKLDEQHRIPKLEYLLGMILMKKHEYPDAANHLQQYLHLATNPSDADEVQKQLAEIARLSPVVVNIPAASEKK
jgi:tetratricopeptide (TPR) repeat protein